MPIADHAADSFGSVTANSRADIQGSIRGRVGIARNRALLYATGGVAFSGFNTSIADSTGFFTGAPASTVSFSNTRVGWTVGGGIEYAVANNWSVRAKYRYSDFGRIADRPFAGHLPAGAATTTFKHRLTQNQVQVGFSYRFDTFNPYSLVAKY